MCARALYYHVCLLLKDSYSYSYEPNLSEDDAKKLVEQYSKGKKLLFLGQWIKPSDIREISIRRTSSLSEEYKRFLESGVERIFLNRIGDDVTRQLITSPPTEERYMLEAMPSKNVFIVHGRDHKPMKELKAMLSEFGLNPIVLHEKPSRGLTLAEKLERYSEDVGFAFVILTPDDVGVSFFELYDQAIQAAYDEEDKAMKAAKRILAQSKGDVQRFIEFNRRFVHDPSDVMEFLSVFKARARQNVIFEMGFFWGFLKRKKVSCLLKGDVEKPSNIEGIVYIPFKESVNEVRNKIIKELKEAGYKIKA